MSDDETVEFEGVFAEKETDLAIFCHIDDKQLWIPKSVVDEDSEVYGRGHTGILVIKRWFAEKEGLV